MRRAIAPTPSSSSSESLPPRPSHVALARAEDAVRTVAQEGSWPRLGPTIQTGQRLLRLQLQNAQPVLACLCSPTQTCTCLTAATQSQAATCLQTASLARLHHHYQKQPSVSSPPATSLKQESSLGSSGPVNCKASYHNGPHRPHASSCPGLGTCAAHNLGPSQASRRSIRGHQTEKQSQTCTAILWQHVAVCKEAKGPCCNRLHSQPSTCGHSKKSQKELGREDAWPLHRSSGASRPAGGRQGRGMGEKRRPHVTSEIHNWLSFPRELSAVRAPETLQPSVLGILARPRSGHVACNWTRPGAAAFPPFLHMLHHTGTCPSSPRLPLVKRLGWRGPGWRLEGKFPD